MYLDSPSYFICPVLAESWKPLPEGPEPKAAILSVWKIKLATMKHVPESFIMLWI